MAENGNSDSGSKDRATVALVDAKVDGLKDLIRAEFANVRDKIHPIAELSTEVIRLRVSSDDHERRLGAIEDASKGDKDYRRIHLPAIIISALVGIATIITVLTQLH